MKKKAIHMKFLNHSIGFCLLLTLLCYSCASDYLYMKQIKMVLLL